jgi:hypothetical protein
MFEDKTKSYIFSTGFSLLALFCIFFFADFLKKPLPFDLKCADTRSMVYGDTSKPVKNIHPKKINSSHSFIAQKIKFRDSTLFLCPNAVAVSKPVCAKDTSIKSILLIGDSQVEFLRTSVYNFCLNNNYNLVASIAWYGSTTAAWASNDTLEKYIETYHPDFVICALGLNEVLTPSVEPRRKYIRTIIKNFTDNNIPYYWIGPAAWTKDYGICSVMQEEMDTLFYPSQKLVLARAPDKRHPSMEASKIWFDSVAVAMSIHTPLSFAHTVSDYKKADKSPFVALGRSSKK